MPPIVIAVSFPITWAATCVTTSGMTGFTLPGMIELPFWSSGRKISERPARGPEPIRRRSLAIFVSETATTLSAPEASTRPSRAACASKWSAGAEIGETGVGGEVVAHACGELRVRVQARPGGRPAERDLAETRHGVLDPSDPLSDLRRIAGELLAERHGHGVHEVRAPGLHDVVELHCLPLERRREQRERGKEIVRELSERSQVHGGREDVVRRLAHVHVVVRVDALAGDRRDDLVRVHVRARTRARSGRRRSGTGRRTRRRRCGRRRWRCGRRGLGRAARGRR